MPKNYSRHGGFVAQNSGDIENCFSLVRVTAKGMNSGGFAGENTGVIKNSYAYSVIKGMESGFVGNEGGDSEEKCYFFHSENKNSKHLKGLKDIEKAISLKDWEAEEDMQVLEMDSKIWRFGSKKCPMMFEEESWFYPVEETETRNIIRISNTEELFNWAQKVNEGNLSYANAMVYLLEDINLHGKEWIPIGSDRKRAFTGIFDGRGHTISNYVIKDRKIENKGFFGFLKGEVYNLSVDCEIRGGTYAGGIAAQNDKGVIGCCSSNIILKGADCNNGGLIGRNSGYVFQSYAAGENSALAIPWIPIGVGAAILFLAGVLFVGVIPAIQNTPVYNPIPEDPKQVPIPGEVIKPKEGTNFVSFQFEKEIAVNLSSGISTLYFKNPGDSNHNVVVQLQITDEVAKQIMGGTGRPAEEQAKYEARDDYDPQAFRVTIAESEAIKPGYQIDSLVLTDYAKENLISGEYPAVIYLIPYDIKTNNRAMLESQLPVNITIK